MRMDEDAYKRGVIADREAEAELYRKRYSNGPVYGPARPSFFEARVHPYIARASDSIRASGEQLQRIYRNLLAPQRAMNAAAAEPVAVPAPAPAPAPAPVAAPAPEENPPVDDDDDDEDALNEEELKELQALQASMGALPPV